MERQYGIWKRSIGLQTKLENTLNVIISCAVLRNICIERNEQLPPDEPEVILMKMLLMTLLNTKY